MNRAEKLKILQEAMQGQTRLLCQLSQQKRKGKMPFLDVAGFVNLYPCSPLLLDLMVMPTESILDCKKGDHISLRECLARFDKVDSAQLYYAFSAVGAIDGNDCHYDRVPLHGMQIQHRNYSKTYLKGGTIADLRRYFHQSASSLDEHPFLLLSLEMDLKRFDFDSFTNRQA
ncbi:hypothetical protein [Spirosoma aerophilum]